MIVSCGGNGELASPSKSASPVDAPTATPSLTGTEEPEPSPSPSTAREVTFSPVDPGMQVFGVGKLDRGLGNPSNDLQR